MTIRRRIIISVVLFLSMTMLISGAINAAPKFSKTNTISIDKKKSKKGKLKGLKKAQKKKKWKFASSDTTVAKVKRSGKYGYKITANKKKDGYAVIRAAQGKNEIYLLVKVGKGSTAYNEKTKAWAKNRFKLPTIEVTRIELNPTELTMAVGESKTIQAKCFPENATDKTIVWSSSDTSIVNVDGGTIKGVKAGKASITATAKNGKTASCSVLVDWVDGTELTVVVASKSASFPITVNGLGTITSVKVRKYHTKNNPVSSVRYEIEICGKVTSKVLENKANIEVDIKYARSDGSAASDITYFYLISSDWISKYGSVDDKGIFKITYQQDENSILVDYDKAAIVSMGESIWH